MGSGSSIEAPVDVLPRILSMCDWKERVNVFALSTFFQNNLSDTKWRDFCEYLAQDGVYISPILPVLDWRKTFFEGWKVRNQIWFGRRSDPGGFSIGVAARFCPMRNPKDDASEEEESDDARPKASMPLHQKLQLIKAAKNCSSFEAKKHLWSRKNPSNDPWARSVVKEVYEEEPEEPGDQNCARACVLAVQPAQVVMFAPGVGLRPFNFSEVFDKQKPQDHIYCSRVAPLVADFVNGRNVTVLCYGQTGSGKTYTMFGPDEEASTHLTWRHTPPSSSGIVPRACREILTAALARRAHLAVSFSASCVEVFGDEVLDLFHGGELVGAWHGVAARSVLDGAAEVAIESLEEFEGLLVSAERTKRRAATAMNERSSRAHTLLLLNLKQRHPRTGVEVRSQFCFADLGGSEQLKKSKATGERLQEAVQINLGLLALKNCIIALNNQSSHVPYKDSTLTLLLSSALGGNARTLVLVTCSLEQRNAMETLHTLRFSERCSKVENRDFVQVSMTEMVQALEREIKECEELIKVNERWETQRIVRVDVDEHGNEKEEVRLRTVPVGAEEYRGRLETLLDRKRVLFAAA